MRPSRRSGQRRRPPCSNSILGSCTIVTTVFLLAIFNHSFFLVYPDRGVVGQGHEAPGKDREVRKTPRGPWIPYRAEIHSAGDTAENHPRFDSSSSEASDCGDRRLNGGDASTVQP